MNLPFNPLPLGKLANVTPGTLIQLTVNCQSLYSKPFYNSGAGGVNGPEDLWAEDLILSPAASNTGTVYVGFSAMVRSTGVQVVVAIKKTDPPVHLAQQVGANKLRVGDYWYDADNSTDSLFVAALVWG